MTYGRHKVRMKTFQGVSFRDLFDQEPQQWGLRGDPFLWREMKAHLVSCPVPADTALLGKVVAKSFLELTGRPPEDGEDFYVERFAHGGMSSGHVSGDFWRHDAVIQLHRNYLNLRKGGSGDMTRMANDHILAKQNAWAANQGLVLIGSQGKRGRRMYTRSLEENLFEPLSPEARKQFMAGDGHYVCVEDDVHKLTKDVKTATVFDELATDWPWVQVQAAIKLDFNLHAEEA